MLLAVNSRHRLCASDYFCPLHMQLKDLEVKPWWFRVTQNIQPLSPNAPSKKPQATLTARAVLGIGLSRLLKYLSAGRTLKLLPLCCCRSFVIQQIPSSNLFMVVVDNKCDCSSAPLVTMDPIEIMYILSRKTALSVIYLSIYLKLNHLTLQYHCIWLCVFCIMLQVQEG